MLLLLLLLLSLFHLPTVLLSTFDSIKIFFTTIVPSLFIMMILSKLILNKQSMYFLSHLVKNPLILYAFLGCILGFSGFVVLLNDAIDKKQLNSTQATYLINHFCLPSAMFMISTIGSKLNNYPLSITLYILQVATCFLLSYPFPKNHATITFPAFTFSFFNKAMLDTGKGLFLIFSYSTLISYFACVLRLYMPSFCDGMFSILVEFSSGALYICNLKYTLSITIILLTICFSLASASAYIQIKALATFPFCLQDFLYYRIKQALVCTLFCFLFIFFF